MLLRFVTKGRSGEGIRVRHDGSGDQEEQCNIFRESLRKVFNSCLNENLDGVGRRLRVYTVGSEDYMLFATS